MSAIWTIAKREFGAYFKSPIAYIVLSAFVLPAGFLFFTRFFLYGNASMEAFFGNFSWIMTFFCPAVAMRLLAEERGTGTIEMLLTLPVTDTQVVLGKFLAAVGVLAVGLLLTLPYVFTVSKLGPLDGGPVVASYIGTLLLGATYLAVGLFTSAMTKNQIIALIVGFLLCLGLFLLDNLFALAGPTFGPVLQYASPAYHYEHMARGVIELRNVIYYLTFIAVLLVLSVQVLESRKWR
ncbi:MAG TPA: ABC transporter permease [Haliangiales bacterium]|nr:ABC transporter permease [Haliangiales bacterium]